MDSVLSRSPAHPAWPILSQSPPLALSRLPCSEILDSAGKRFKHPWEALNIARDVN